jgi:adenylyltransferase/sulfurtransferase
MIFLSANEINNQLKNNNTITVIDIREPYELDICSIGFRNIPMASIIDHLDELKSANSIVLMCRSGKRAESVANWLESDYNFTNVIVMEGGIVQWKEQVDPTLVLED